MKINPNIMLFAENSIEINARLWFPLRRRNGLVSISEDGENIDVRWIPIPGLDMFKEAMFTDILNIDNKLILVPHACEKIGIYDVEMKTFSFLPTPQSMYRGFVYDKYAFMVGWEYPGIVKIDIKNGSMECFDIWTDCSGDIGYIPKKHHGPYFSEGLIYEKYGNVLLPVGNACGLLRFNVYNGKKDFLYLDGFFDCVSGIALCGDKIFVSGSGKNSCYFLILDKQGNIIDKLCVLEKSENYALGYSCLKYHRGILYAFPSVGGKFKMVDVREMRVIPLEKYNGLFEVDDSKLQMGIKFGNVKITENIIKFIAGDTLLWHSVNMDTGDDETKSYIDTNLNSIDFFCNAAKSYGSRGIQMNESILNLESYLEWVCTF